MNENSEFKEFPRKIRNYLIKRCVIIYFIVAGTSIGLGFLFSELISPFVKKELIPLVLSLIIAGFVIGINLVLQMWSKYYPLPKELQKLIQKAGFKVGKKKFYHFRFFRRTQIFPTEEIYIKIGLEVKYFPFLELKRGTCRINMISKKLCSANDPISKNIVQNIAEKNLLAWKNDQSTRKARVKARVVDWRGGLNFKTSCSPEEAISRMMQMGKAIREWENAISKISEIATST
ncbi:MAG: hypothetical protein ACTSRG_00840 [Candidatus Helarchaeota archaeon]